MLIAKLYCAFIGAGMYFDIKVYVLVQGVIFSYETKWVSRSFTSSHIQKKGVLDILPFTSCNVFIRVISSMKKVYLKIK